MAFEQVPPVLHGYCRSAATTAQKTRKLRDALDGVAVLHYVDGPSMPPYPSRPWWIMDQAFEYDSFGSSRWDDVVKWWSKELSERHYDGIIGLSQGSAMAALLLSMVSMLLSLVVNQDSLIRRSTTPNASQDSAPRRNRTLNSQYSARVSFLVVAHESISIIFALGFVSHTSPHTEIYGIPDIPILHSKVFVRLGVLCPHSVFSYRRRRHLSSSCSKPRAPRKVR
jgi:hypothetical protein